MKIRCVVFASFSRAQDAFPFQSRVLKIKEQGQIQPSDIRYPKHLSYVRVSETGHHFGIDDHSVLLMLLILILINSGFWIVEASE